MFTPSVQFQQSIQNIQSTVQEAAKEVKSKIANSKDISPKDLELLDRSVDKINSNCEQIQRILSSHDVNQPRSFSPKETMKLEILNNKLKQNQEFFNRIV